MLFIFEYLNLIYF